MRALAPEPNDRFPSCTAFAKAFEDGLVSRREFEYARGPGDPTLHSDPTKVSGSAGGGARGGARGGRAVTRGGRPLTSRSVEASDPGQIEDGGVTERRSRKGLVLGLAALAVLGGTALVFSRSLFGAKPTTRPPSWRVSPRTPHPSRSALRIQFLRPWTRLRRPRCQLPR